MGWAMPPEAVRRRVNTVFGTDMYARLAEVWDAAQGDLPSAIPAYRKVEQTRFLPPEQIHAEYGKPSETSGHYLGLNIDVGGLSPDIKAKIANSLYVSRIKTPIGLVPIVVEGLANSEWQPGRPLPPGHLHWGIGQTTLKRLGMIPYIQSIVAGLRGQLASR